MIILAILNNIQLRYFPTLLLLITMSFIERRVRGQVNAALTEAKKILDTTRRPVLPTDAPHTYTNKFTLAEMATQVSSASLVIALEECTAWSSVLPRLQAWAKEGKTVTMRHTTAVKIAFLRTETRKEESATSTETQVSTTLLGKFQSKTKVVRTIIEHFWRATHEWSITCYAGGDPSSSDAVEIIANTSFCEVKTIGNQSDAQADAAKTPPFQNKNQNAEMNLNWLLGRMDASGDSGAVSFAIDRSSTQCRTPARNPQITAMQTFRSQAERLWSAIKRDVQHAGRIEAKSTFATSGGDRTPWKLCTELPFDATSATFCLDESALVRGSGGDGDDDGASASTTADDSPATAPLLSADDIAAFLTHFRTSLQRYISSSTAPAAGAAGGDGVLLTVVEVKAIALAMVGSNTFSSACRTIEAIEAMLKQQIISAVGKSLDASDFNECVLSCLCVCVCGLSAGV